MKTLTVAIRNTFNATKLKLLILLAIIIQSHVNQLSAQVIDSTRTTSTEIKTFRSKILNEDRKIYIRTPSKMKATDKYPVLYLLDGDIFIGMVGSTLR